MVNTLLMTDGKNAASSTAGSSTGSYLIPHVLYNQLVMAVRRDLVLSGLAAMRFGPSSIPGSAITIPRQTASTLNINRVAEGAEFPKDAEEYSSLTLTPVKYGVNIGVSDEMEEDSLFDVLRMNIDKAGYEMAVNEESLIITALDAASTAASQNVANSNATLPVTDITQAIQYLRTNNYNPTDFIIGAELENDIYNIDTFTEADKSGMNNPSNRLIGRIAGMNVIVSNAVSAKLGYVIDRRHAFVIAEKRPLTIRTYDDVGRDMRHAVVSQRVSVSALRNEAVSEITTT